MTSTQNPLLAEIDDYRLALEAASLDDELPLPRPPVIPEGSALAADDLVAAGELLSLIQATEARLSGLRTRVAGELAGMRRPSKATRRRAPRTLDTSA